MYKILSCIPASARWPLLSLVFLSAAACHPAAPEPARAPHATRRELIGAWRLISIEIKGPNGPSIDPFYNADSTGILIYDPSGWMSVQIVGQPRPAMEVPAARPARSETGDDARLKKDAQLKAAVLDTYYAYFATWEYDDATSTVTHHIKSSLIPGERDKSYSQTVTLDGAELVFTARRDAVGGATVQRKVWRRISGPAAYE